MNNNTTLEQMMNFMLHGKKEALQISLIIYTIILFIVLLIFILINYSISASQLKSTIIKILITVIITTYLLCVSFRCYTYYYSAKNESPFYFGIYEAYYECSNCKSLSGGIYGKGPTSEIILNTNCVHKWQAIFKNDFDTKISAKKQDPR